MKQSSSLKNFQSLRKNIDKDKHTTHTKASMTKPNVFNISLARNKNNIKQHPMLFGSIKKNKENIK
jgi:hypothetical protein